MKYFYLKFVYHLLYRSRPYITHMFFINPMFEISMLIMNQCPQSSCYNNDINNLSANGMKLYFNIKIEIINFSLKYRRLWLFYTSSLM